MKFLTLLSLFFSVSSFASNCPDFSGAYLLSGSAALVTVSQVGCEKISVTVGDAGTETRIADGRFREVTDPFGKLLYSSTVFTETRLVMEDMDPTKSFIEVKSNFRKAGNNFIASNLYYNEAGEEVYRSGALFEKIQR